MMMTVMVGCVIAEMVLVVGVVARLVLRPTHPIRTPPDTLP